MKSKKEMTLGRAMLYILIGLTVLFAPIYLITSWIKLSFTEWGETGRTIFLVLTVLFGLITWYGYKIVTSKALDDEMDRVMAEMDKDKEDKAIIDTII